VAVGQKGRSALILKSGSPHAAWDGNTKICTESFLQAAPGGLSALPLSIGKNSNFAIHAELTQRKIVNL
jgi:hypothetical protein